MIGGIDIQLPTRAGVSALEAAVRAIRQKWPLAVFENGLTGAFYPRFRDIPFGQTEEIFVYTNASAANLWDSEGATDDTLNSMIHLIRDRELLTVVMDEETTEMTLILESIRSALADEILVVEVKEAA